MKVLVFFVLLCALIEVNRAHFEKIYGQIDSHDMGTKKAWVEVDPGSTTEIEFVFPQVSKISSNALLSRKKLD